MDSQATYLFTYGTLMQGFDNPFSAKLRSEAEYVGTGRIPGTLYLISWYPGAIYQPGSVSKVHGEIFQLHSPEALLAELDEYEDVFEDEKASLYLRKKIPVTLEDDSMITCWVYLYNQPIGDLQIIHNGRFTH